MNKPLANEHVHSVHFPNTKKCDTISLWIVTPVTCNPDTRLRTKLVKSFPYCFH